MVNIQGQEKWHENIRRNGNVYNPSSWKAESSREKKCLPSWYSQCFDDYVCKLKRGKPLICECFERATKATKNTPTSGKICAKIAKKKCVFNLRQATATYTLVIASSWIFVSIDWTELTLLALMPSRVCMLNTWILRFYFVFIDFVCLCLCVFLRMIFAYAKADCRILPF